MAVAIELDGIDVVVGAHPAGDGQAFAGLEVDQHHGVVDRRGAGDGSSRAEQGEDEHARRNQACGGAMEDGHDVSPVRARRARTILGQGPAMAYCGFHGASCDVVNKSPEVEGRAGYCWSSAAGFWPLSSRHWMI